MHVSTVLLIGLIKLGCCWKRQHSKAIEAKVLCVISTVLLMGSGCGGVAGSIQYSKVINLDLDTRGLFPQFC